MYNNGDRISMKVSEMANKTNRNLTAKDDEPNGDNAFYFYFAYGSNMNANRMKERGVNFHRREPAELPGYQFLLNKLVQSNGTAAANVIEDSSSCVYGALYTSKDKNIFCKLDKFEGVATKQYERKEVIVNLHRGGSKKAFVYIALEDSCRKDLKVHPDYFKHILAGADILPPFYVDYLKSFQRRVLGNEMPSI